MLQTIQQLGIDRMSIDERIELAEAIWESIHDEAVPPSLSDAQKKELDRRIVEHEADPSTAIPWDDVYTATMKRHSS